MAALALVAGWSGVTVLLLAHGETVVDAMTPVAAWRLERRVDANHPFVRKIAEAIVNLTPMQHEQIALAEQAAWRRIRYANENDVWGRRFVPTIDEMLARASAAGWPSPRGNCVSQAIVLRSVLAALGHESRIATGPDHAWVQVRLDGAWLDLLYPEAVLTQSARISAVRFASDHADELRALGADAAGHFAKLDPLPPVRGRAAAWQQPLWFLALVPLVLAWAVVLTRWHRAFPRSVSASRAATKASKPREGRIPARAKQGVALVPSTRRRKQRRARPVPSRHGGRPNRRAA